MQHYDSLNLKMEAVKIGSYIKKWMELVNKVESWCFRPSYGLPQQSVGSNDCGVYVCLYIDYALFSLTPEELVYYGQHALSKFNRDVIKSRILFFESERIECRKWDDTSQNMVVTEKSAATLLHEAFIKSDKGQACQMSYANPG